MPRTKHFLILLIACIALGVVTIILTNMGSPVNGVSQHAGSVILATPADHYGVDTSSEDKKNENRNAFIERVRSALQNRPPSEVSLTEVVTDSGIENGDDIPEEYVETVVDEIPMPEPVLTITPTSTPIEQVATSTVVQEIPDVQNLLNTSTTTP